MQGWHEGIINGAKDKSVYTVEFDDGDVRSLSRGSLCLQGKLRLETNVFFKFTSVF